MIKLETTIPEVILFKPNVFEDNRGHFFESYNNKLLKNIGINANFVQDNQSFSNKGVLRGLHYQTGDMAQSKLVRVLQGEVLDVAVDIRKNSPTYGKHFSAILSDKNFHQMFIPRGFAHGFVVLSETALFYYKCDNYYSKEHEGGIIFNDPKLNIDWKLDKTEYNISEKDIILPTIDNCINTFVYQPYK